jgi:predicted patatin/cPLA2 family phospholipase
MTVGFLLGMEDEMVATFSKNYSGLDKIPSGHAGDMVQEGCLVIEGGAFRGMYNEGVLDAFMLNDINIRTVIGVSAGALAGMNYVSGQIGRSARANLGYRHDSRYIGRRAFRKSHSIIDIDFLLKTFEKYEPLDRDRLLSDDRHFIAVATSCMDGETKYYDKENCTNILEAVKASASMPYVAPMVNIDGTLCLDGGCSCKIAYQWALDHEFEKIVIVKTRERGYRKPQKKSETAFRFYREYPEFAGKLANSNIEYCRECDEIDELERTGRAYVVAPSSHVTVGRLEPDLEKLGELYWQGYNDALSQMEELKKYLNV